MVSANPAALAIFISYCSTNDRELLKTFAYFKGAPHEAANVSVQDLLNSPHTLPERMNVLRRAHEAYQKVKEFYPFTIKATEDEIELCSYIQHKTHKDPSNVYVTSSVSDQIFAALVSGEHRQAQSLRSTFKVPERRYWWLRVKAAATDRDWALLEIISREKKSPIGYEPFAEACIREGASHEAAKYITKIADQSVQIALYIRIGYLREAAEVAGQAKDLRALAVIRSKTKDTNLLQLIDSLEASLRQAAR